MSSSSNSSVPIRIHPRELAVALTPLTVMVASLYLLAQLLGTLAQLVLLFGAACLISLLVVRLAGKLQEVVGLPRKIGTILVILIASAFVLGILFLAGSQAVAQFDQLANQIPQIISGWQTAAKKYELTGSLSEMAGNQMSTFKPNMLFGQVRGLFSSLSGFFTATVFVLAVALYLCLDPKTYQRGLLRLIRSSQHRERAADILKRLGDQLWYFLLGQMASMTIIGVLTTAGLWFLDIPSHLALGLIAGVLAFIPVLGPALSFLPAVVVAASKGLHAVLWVGVLYGGVQFLEGNFLTPIIQRKMSSIPPVLLMVAQAGMGLLFGLIGVALAAPTTVIIMVLVRELYLKDIDDPPSERIVADIETAQDHDQRQDREPEPSWSGTQTTPSKTLVPETNLNGHSPTLYLPRP